MIKNCWIKNTHNIPPGTPPAEIFDTRCNKVIGHTTNVTKDRVYMRVTDESSFLLNQQERRSLMFYSNYP